MKPSELQTVEAEEVESVTDTAEIVDADNAEVVDAVADTAEVVDADTADADADVDVVDAEVVDAPDADAAEPVEPEAAPLRIVSIQSCSSLSGRSTLTYHIGFNDSSNSEASASPEPQIRIYKNTGHGQFNRDWVALPEIVQVLSASVNVNITSSTLQCLFPGKSTNSAGFVLASLKHEGLIKVSPLNQRTYVLVEPEAYLARCRAMASAGSLDADQVPAKPVPEKPVPAKPLPAKRSKR